MKNCEPYPNIYEEDKHIAEVCLTHACYIMVTMSGTDKSINSIKYNMRLLY